MSALFANVDWPGIAQATFETLAMLAGSLVLTVAFGLPLGVLLFLTGRGQMFARPGLNRLLSLIVNILRSVPFIILLILMMPLTLATMGTSLGERGAILLWSWAPHPSSPGLSRRRCARSTAASSRLSRPWARSPARSCWARCCPRPFRASWPA